MTFTYLNNTQTQKYHAIAENFSSASNKIASLEEEILKLRNANVWLSET